MAEFHAKCPSCGATLKSASAPPAGAKVKCPKCSKVLTLNKPARSGSSSGDSRERSSSSSGDSRERSGSSSGDSRERSGRSSGERKAGTTSGVTRKPGSQGPAKPGMWADFPRWTLVVTGGGLAIALLVGILAITGVFSGKSPKKAVAAAKEQQTTPAEPEPDKTPAKETTAGGKKTDKTTAKDTKSEGKEAGQPPTKETGKEPKETKNAFKEPDKFFEVVNDDPKEPWKKILSKEGGFLVLLPETPQEKPGDKAVVLEAKLDENLFRLKFIEVSAEELVEGGKPYLRDMKEDRPGSKHKDITVQKSYPGIELIYETTMDEKTTVTTERIIVDRPRSRSFQLSVTSPKGKEDAAGGKKFFDSFKLVDSK